MICMYNVYDICRTLQGMSGEKCNHVMRRKRMNQFLQVKDKAAKKITRMPLPLLPQAKLE